MNRQTESNETVIEEPPDSIQEIRRARALAGGCSELSEIAGVSRPMVSQWTAGIKPVSPRAAAAIELALDVRADKLCPLVPWDRLPALLAVRRKRAQFRPYRPREKPPRSKPRSKRSSRRAR